MQVWALLAPDVLAMHKSFALTAQNGAKGAAAAKLGVQDCVSAILKGGDHEKGVLHSGNVPQNGNLSHVTNQDWVVGPS